MRNKILSIGLIVVFATVLSVGAVWGLEMSVSELLELLGGNNQGEVLGGSTSASWSVGGNLSVTGVSTLSGGVVADVDSITATTTLTTASANVQLLAASANNITVTLPAVTDGARFEFIVQGALTGPAVIIDSAEGDNIEGTLIVNSAVVACSGEDQINIITDGESIGDRFEIISDGTSWYLIDSEIETAAKATCTDPS